MMWRLLTTCPSLMRREDQVVQWHCCTAMQSDASSFRQAQLPGLQYATTPHSQRYSLAINL